MYVYIYIVLGLDDGRLGAVVVVQVVPPAARPRLGCGQIGSTTVSNNNNDNNNNNNNMLIDNNNNNNNNSYY